MGIVTLINTTSDGSGAWSVASAPAMSVQSTGLNLNSTGDVASILTGLPARFVVTEAFLSNFSTTPSILFAATVRDAASGAGNSLCGNLSGMNTVVTSTTQAARAVALTSLLSAQVANVTGKLYFNVSTANGSALTADITLVILPLP